jgi:hypothetical protein
MPTLKTNNMTHLEQIRAENQQVKAQIQTLLDWDNHTFCHFQEAMGYAYLSSEDILSSMAVQELTYMKSFWSWWRNQWVKRDIQFLQDVMVSTALPSKSKIVTRYQQYHQTKASLFKPHKEVLRQSYARFIGKLNKEIVNG